MFFISWVNPESPFHHSLHSSCFSIYSLISRSWIPLFLHHSIQNLQQRENIKKMKTSTSLWKCCDFEGALRGHSEFRIQGEYDLITGIKSTVIESTLSFDPYWSHMYQQPQYASNRLVRSSNSIWNSYRPTPFWHQIYGGQRPTIYIWNAMQQLVRCEDVRKRKAWF